MPGENENVGKTGLEQVQSIVFFFIRWNFTWHVSKYCWPLQNRFPIDHGIAIDESGLLEMSVFQGAIVISSLG